jgi:hypothetical protein
MAKEKKGYDHPKHRRSSKKGDRVDPNFKLCKMKYSTIDPPTIKKRPAGDPTGDILARAFILPNSNEYIEYVELYDDDSGQPGYWVGDLYYVGTESNGKEKWEATDYEIYPDHPVDTHKYHVVCWVTAHGYNSQSGPAG